MSSSGGWTVELQTFGSDNTAVDLPAHCTCKDALPLIAKKLKLKLESMKVFGLFCGKLGKPYKLLRESDVVPMATPLALQRWCMQADSEAKIVKHDDQAIHLLYCEAKHNLEIENLHPSDEQRLELESFSDPLFPTEKQFLAVVRQVPGYSAYVARQCTVTEDIEDNKARIPAGTQVKVAMDLEGMALKADREDGKNEILLHWPWNIVKRWKRLPSQDVIKFEVCLQKINAGILSWVTLNTHQAELLFQASGALCAELKRVQDMRGAGPGDPNPQMVGKFVDPLRELVENALFAEPKFSKWDS